MERPPHSRQVRRRPTASGFSLIELLVVVAILALLVALLLPVLRTARTGARLVRAQAELRQIDLALQMYADNHKNRLPPARFSCSTRTAYELPLELGRGGYLPQQVKPVTINGQQGLLDAVAMPDVFDPRETYKYRAVGPAIINESTLLEPPQGASLWVPDDFPQCRSDDGRYHYDPRTSPARYAVWSVGPDAGSPKFAYVPGRMPLPRRYWCTGAGDTGIIALYRTRGNELFTTR